MTDQEKLDLYNEILNKHSQDEVLALKFGLAETMGVKKHIEELALLHEKMKILLDALNSLSFGAAKAIEEYYRRAVK